MITSQGITRIILWEFSPQQLSCQMRESTDFLCAERERETDYCEARSHQSKHIMSLAIFLLRKFPPGLFKIEIKKLVPLLFYYFALAHYVSTNCLHQGIISEGIGD